MIHLGQVIFTNMSALGLPEFNISVYKAHEVDKWKFLGPLDPVGYKELGPLVSSPYPIAILTSLYITFVCFIGPIYMKNRQPYKLKNIIRFYNLIMVILAAVLLYQLYDAIESLGSLFDCKRLFTFADQSATKVYQMSNFILMIRISEYLDTIFFTLRKKTNQITFLHVFHHAFVPIYAYWIIRTGPLRFNVYIIFVNSFIHVLMYFYYFIATFAEMTPQQQQNSTGTRLIQSTKPQQTTFLMVVIQKLLMFKKYMTLLQILQFVSLVLYAIWPLFMTNRCNIPNTYIIANIMLALGFLALFCHFYVQTYRNRAAAAAARKKQ